MRRVLHISDLHFGRTRAELLDPLVETINRLAPDLVAFSGDLTQRAREGQFRQAAAFIERLAAPVLAVPGNHDTPIDNPWLRFVKPFHRYRHIISPELEPDYADEEVALVGVNTVNRWAWQSGKIGRHTIRRVCDAFAGAPDGRTHLAMMHHPLEHDPGTEKRLMRGARAAVASLGRCGADVVLSGHLHNAAVAPLTAAPGVLLVQAGTGLSSRLREETNNFNLLHVEPGRIRVERYGAEDRPRFEIVQTARFVKAKGVWREV
ncbi:metallophosphoesterase family protein [Limimaricola pyoseonensis]|uniref:3',5'-cyclic AMP phosphodiesterase CpdA n=1 Tax=Limimaricola pyoseonensis TaxID=521013 RepID=A0A1G7ELH0_9RHOB|nr:metallophosphoesterase [Limimaricola pyoseonensis]SDE64489.1 3',5'-cyclic AMP phosphodiesterase CpdA [Limimaricola pyoseonensis]